MSRKMQGVIFTGGGNVEVREFSVGEPVGTQVLVELRAAGLCGSDMHPYRNPPEYWRQYPIIRGHEPGGIVRQVGEAVSMVKTGDRVSVYHAPTCGHCEPCANGEYFRCTTIGDGYRLASLKVHGCDADYVLVDQNVCFPVPDELSFEDAAIVACAGGTAFHALTLADVTGPETVLVSGLGPVGLCVVRLAIAMGSDVIGADPVAYRRDIAKSLGARVVYDPSQIKASEYVKSVTRDGAEIAVETSGNDQARIDIVAATPYHARLVYVGWGGKAANFSLGPSLGERRITGSNMFTGPDYYRLINFMLKADVRFADLVTHRFSLDQAQQAFDLFETDETGKVMFIWSEHETRS